MQAAFIASKIQHNIYYQDINYNCLNLLYYTYNKHNVCITGVCKACKFTPNLKKKKCNLQHTFKLLMKFTKLVDPTGMKMPNFRPLCLIIFCSKNLKKSQISCMTQLNNGPISARIVMLGYSKTWQNAYEICVFSVEVLRLWVHGMWCGGVRHIGTNILAESGISIFRVRRKELSYPEEGDSRFLQNVWIYLPNLMVSQPMTLFSTNLSPHYIPHA